MLNINKLDNFKLATLCIYVITGRRMRSSGLCRLLNTSRTNCWDGNQNRTTDIPDFDDDDIIDQGNFHFTIIIK